MGGIPLPALAGVLIATCVQMIEVGSLTAMMWATRSDAVVQAARGLTHSVSG